MIKLILMYGMDRVEWAVLLDGICYFTIILNDGTEFSFSLSGSI